MSLTTTAARVHARVALSIVIALSMPSAVYAQSTLDSQYGLLVSRYADGAHVASVVELLGLPVADVVKTARTALEQQSRLYARGRDPASTETRPPGDLVVAYLRHLRATAALHLEAAISAPPSRVTARYEHLAVAEAAFRELDPSRALWQRDPHVKPSDRPAISSFRHDWWLIAATHFQRTGRFADALRFVEGAIGEFDERPVFRVVEGSIFEALASPVATFDGARAFIGLPRDPEEGSREALLRAARSFERALALDPSDAEARLRLARVHLQLGAFETARRYLIEEAAPGRQSYLRALTRGQLAEAERQFGAAVGHYREAVSVSDQWQTACFALSHALVKQARHDQARVALRTCLSREPGGSDPWHAYAMGLEWLVDPTVRQLRLRIRADAVPPHE